MLNPTLTRQNGARQGRAGHTDPVTSVGVFVGMTCLDVVLSADRPPGPDEKVNAGRQDVSVGGPATNAARTYAALGGHARLVTGLGRHRLAGLIREELTDEGVEVIDLTPDATDAPTVASVVVSTGGQRAVVSRPPWPVAASPARLLALLAGAGVALLDGHQPALAVPLAAAAAQRGLPVAIDAGRPKPVFDELFPYATAIVCAQAWAGEDLRGLVRNRTSFVAVTAGGGPIRWWTGANQGRLVPPVVPAVNTLGAGDVLHGAFAHGLAGGADPVHSLHEAMLLASRRCAADSLAGWLSELRGRM